MVFGRSRLGLPPLEPAPPVSSLPPARLQSGARYLATSSGGRVVRDHGLRGVGSCRLSLSDEGLDVVRLAGPFRIPAAALSRARIEGDELVVCWSHGEHDLETRFRLTPAADLAQWSRTIAKIARSHPR